MNLANYGGAYDMDENTENDTLNIDCICVGDTIQDTTDFVFDFDGLEFGMFPNPTTGEVTLRVDGFHAGVTMQVMDGAGRVVWSEQNLALRRQHGVRPFSLERRHVQCDAQRRAWRERSAIGHPALKEVNHVMAT